MRFFPYTKLLAPPLLGVLGMLVLLPRARGATADAPLVNLDSLEVEPGGATASTTEGGTAELTLDPSLVRVANRLLARARPSAGAIIAVDATTGRVLSLAGFQHGASSPSMASSLLAPAASLFKIVTTTALLEKHVSPDRNVCVEGGSSGISEEHLHRPERGAALCGPFREALGRSRNAVFAQLATRFLTKADLVDTAARFGFGREAPFDARTQIGTLEVPDGELELARAAAGFVGSRLSPVGALSLATTIASGGRGMRMHLVRAAGDYVVPRRELMGRVMHESTARELVRMMEVTVHTGTSREVFTDPDGQNYLGDVRAAGKTGTLQPDDDGPTTSWFVGFAPSRNPKIVVSVLLENGSTWREKANQVGRDLLRAYFAARGYRGVTMPDGV